jgi:hypothetical protein
VRQIEPEGAVMLLRICFLCGVVIVAIAFTHILNMQKLRAMQNGGPAAIDVQAY